MARSLNKFGLVALVLLLSFVAAFYFLRKDVPRLYINEFMASSSACCPDTIGNAREFDDWIEIYNGGSVPVNIGGMYFSQNKKKPLEYQIPQTNPEVTTIQPGGFLLIWADGNPGQGILHVNFKLDPDGEFLGLYNQDGRTIDGYKFGKQKENISFGRDSDGGDKWREFSSPTPGRSNR